MYTENVKILVLSDIHIGDPRLSVAIEMALADIIATEMYDKLILNGDIIDTWISGYAKAAHNSLVVHAINALTKPVIWVKGNHDPQHDQTILPKALMLDYHVEVLNNQKTIFIHGDRVYAYKNMAWYQKFATKINVALYRWLSVDIQGWLRKRDSYKKYSFEKREEINRLYDKSCQAIVTGHTHLQTQQGRIFDGGSSMLGNYIYISDRIYMHTLKK